MTGPTFENTYPRYPFAPLVALALMLANRIKAARKAARKAAGQRQSLKSLTGTRA